MNNTSKTTLPPTTNNRTFYIHASVFHHDMVFLFLLHQLLPFLFLFVQLVQTSLVTPSLIKKKNKEQRNQQQQKNSISFHPTTCTTTHLSSHLASLRVQSFAKLFSCLIRFDGESNCFARAPPWLILKVHFNLVLADGSDVVVMLVVVGSVEWEF